MSNQPAVLTRLLDRFFDNYRNDSEKVQISRTLVAFSEKQTFLETAITLLSETPLSQEKVLLICCMIKDKFKYEFELLNPNKIRNYYQSLHLTAEKFGIQSRAVFELISESLALIYLNYITFPTTMGVSLKEFLGPFFSEEPQKIQINNYYFKILEYCPRVATSSKVILDSFAKQYAQEKLKKQQSVVINILNDSIQDFWFNPSKSKHVSKARIVECFESWMDLQYNPQVYNNIHQTNLLTQTIALLKGSDLTLIQKAASCLRAIIHKFQPPQSNPQLYQYIGSQICSLLPFIDLRLEKGQLYEIEELIGLIIYFSMESVHNLVYTYSEETKDYFFCLVKFINTGFQIIIDDLLQFWETALQLFIKAKSQGKLQANKVKMDLPIALLHALTSLIKYPVQFVKDLDVYHEQTLGNRYYQAEQIYKYRDICQDIFQSLAQLMGAGNYIQYILQVISEVKGPTVIFFFSEVECWLYSLISGVKKEASITNSMFKIVEFYEKLYQTRTIPVIVTRTFLRIFRFIATKHTQNYNLLQRLFYCIFESFDNHMLITQAAQTFYKASIVNPSYLSGYREQVFQVINSYPLQVDLCRAYVNIVCYDKKNAHTTVYDFLDFLLKFASENMLNKSQSINNIMFVIRELDALDFEYKPELFQAFTKNAWNFIISGLKVQNTNQKEDKDIRIERMVRFVKYIMRITKHGFIQYLQSLFEKVIQYFQKNPINSYIYLLQIAVTVYSPYPALQDFLQETYNLFTQNAFKHLEKIQSLDKYCDLIEDFLGMNIRVLNFNTQIVISSPHFERLLKFTIEDCLQTTSYKVKDQNYTFFENLFMIFWNKQLVWDKCKRDRQLGDTNSPSQHPTLKDPELQMNLNAYLLASLPSILKSMLQNLAQETIEKSIVRILDAILSSIKAFPQANCIIWKPILQEMSPCILLQSQKQKVLYLLQKINEQQQNLDELKSLFKQADFYLSLICDRMGILAKRKRLQLNK